MRILLLPIAFLYHIVLSIRHKLYDWRILKSLRFEYPTIGVGNLNLGGTGKTPTVEYLINILRPHYRVATLSRGYGRKTTGFKRADATCTYEDVGDEPLQYFQKFPDIQVAVDEDRLNGMRKLIQSKNTPDVYLLDDAFQHRRIKVGLNLLLTEYQHLYCDDFLFPTGTLRDVKSAAKRADIIVVSKSPKELEETEKQRIIKKLKPKAHQKVFFSYLEYKALIPWNYQAEAFDPNTADAALLFCGIARPQPLIEKLKELYKHLDVMTFPDHHIYTQHDAKNIKEHFDRLMGERKIIITTEKDDTRLQKSPYFCKNLSAPLYDLPSGMHFFAPLYILPVAVRFHEEEKFNQEILNYVRQNKHHC